MVDSDRYSFFADWYDTQASLTRRYLLVFYPQDGTVEMIDTKARKLFLKRTSVPNVNLNSLFVGASLNIMGRQVTLADYADDFTRNSFGNRKERTLGIIKTDGLKFLGQIFDLIYQTKLTIATTRMIKLSRADASDFLTSSLQSQASDSEASSLSDGSVVILELVGPNAISEWQALLGPANPTIAKDQSPNSIRARFGTDAVRNVAWGSTQTSAAQDLSFFFASKPRWPAISKNNNSTLILIKPHAVNAGLSGKIIDLITQAGFKVTGLLSYYLDRANAEEFLEVYKGVLVEYHNMVLELTSGLSLALEVSGTQDVQQSVRELCGPMDPEIARHIRPHTIRAKFGVDKIQNAVHCTDLPDDVDLELEYFFTILGS